MWMNTRYADLIRELENNQGKRDDKRELTWLKRSNNELDSKNSER